LNPFPLHARRDFLSGTSSGFAGIAASKKRFPISTAGTFRRGLLALALAGFALALPTAVAVAAPAEEQDFAALQAKTKKVFTDRVMPFIKSYCVKCHGPRPEGGINFLATYKDPGSPAFRQWWESRSKSTKKQNRYVGCPSNENQPGKESQP